MDIFLLPLVILSLFEWPWFTKDHSEPECVPVEDCSPLNWIYLNKANSTNLAAKNFFQSSICGQDREGRHGVWVRCPRVKNLEGKGNFDPIFEF
jgi:hypothetical protein